MSMTSRRMTTTVSTEAELNSAIVDDATVSLQNDITLTGFVRINGITGLVIQGNGFTVGYATQATSGYYRCFIIYSSSEVTMEYITMKNGYAVSQWWLV